MPAGAVAGQSNGPWLLEKGRRCRTAVMGGSRSWMRAIWPRCGRRWRALEIQMQYQPPARGREFKPQFADVESWVNEFFLLTFGLGRRETLVCVVVGSPGGAATTGLALALLGSCGPGSRARDGAVDPRPPRPESRRTVQLFGAVRAMYR